MKSENAVDEEPTEQSRVSGQEHRPDLHKATN